MQNVLERSKLFCLFVQKYIAHLLFFLLCVLTLVPLLVSSNRQAKQELLKGYQNTLEQGLSNLDAEIESVIQMGSVLKENTSCRNLLSVTGNPDIPLIYEDMLSLQDTLTNLCLSQEFCRDVYILFRDNPICISNNFTAVDYRTIYPAFLNGQDSTAEEWYKRWFSNPVPFKIESDPHFISQYGSPNGYHALIFVVNISPHTIFTKQSVLVYNLDFVELAQNIIPPSLSENSFLYLTDSEGAIIASWNLPEKEADTDSFSILTSSRSNSGHQLVLGIPRAFIADNVLSPLRILKSYLSAGIVLIFLFSVFLAFREITAMRKIVRTASVLFPSSSSSAGNTNEYTYISNILMNNAANLNNLNYQVKSFALENLFLSDKKVDPAWVHKLFQEPFHACCTVIIRLSNYSHTEDRPPIPLEEHCRDYLSYPFFSAYTDLSELSLLILSKEGAPLHPSDLETCMKNILNLIQKQAGTDTAVHVGISSVFSGIDHIREAYLQAQSTLSLLADANVSGVYLYKESQSLIYQKTLDVSLLMKFYDGLLSRDKQAILSFFDHICAIVEKQEYDRQEALQILFSVRQPLFNAYLEICTANECDGFTTNIEPPVINLHCPPGENLAHLQDYALHLCEQIQTRKDAKHSVLVDDVLQFMQENCCDPNFSVFTVTGAFSMSKNYVLQLTKDATGKTLKTYVESLRIDKAELLLKNTSMTNLQIAEECGFYSENTFYRAFARRHGTTPSKWVEGLISSDISQ